MPRRLHLQEEISPNRSVVPSDLGQLKWVLSRFGLYDPSEDADPARDDLMSPRLRSAIERFQDSQRLSVDGLLQPGGPTEARLNFMLGTHDLPGMAPGLHDRNGRPIPEQLADFEARRAREATPGALAGRVGPGLENHPDDLAATATMLTERGWLGGEAGAPGDHAGDALLDAVRRFQSANGLTVDGVITPDGETETALLSSAATQQLAPGGGPRISASPVSSETVDQAMPWLASALGQPAVIRPVSAGWPSGRIPIPAWGLPGSPPPEAAKQASRDIQRRLDEISEQFLDLPLSGPGNIPWGFTPRDLLNRIDGEPEASDNPGAPAPTPLDTLGTLVRLRLGPGLVSPEEEAKAYSQIQYWVEELGEQILDAPLTLPLLGTGMSTPVVTLRDLFDGPTGAPPTPGDPVEPIRQPGFSGEPPTDPEDERPPEDSTSEEPLGDTLENIPPEAPIEPESYPVLDPETLVEGIIVEARRGTGHTPRDIDLSRKLFERLLNKYGGPGVFKPDGGGRSRKKGVVSWIPEPRYPNANAGPGESGVPGSSFGDTRYTNEERGIVLLAQHQTTLADGRTPSKLERKNAERLMDNARAVHGKKETPYLVEYPKRTKGEETKPWLLRILPILIEQLEDQGLITGVNYETPLRG